MSLILGIESSCDETAVALVRDGYEVVGSAVATQIAKHACHGGVVPELAAREHLIALDYVLEEALKSAGCGLDEVNGIAVTQGPGLIPALLVGINYAKGLAINLRRPITGVNHFIAHIYGAFLNNGKGVLEDKNSYPILALVVSGGHTSLLLITEDGSARHLGCTIDDAAGEALDKASKLLGLGYPGGPAVQKAAAGGDPARFHFPRPLTGSAGKALAAEHKFDFSFSGIKTALLYQVEKLQEEYGTLPSDLLSDVAASFQQAVVDVLVKKTMSAVKEFAPKTVVAAGGVACNALLREQLAAAMPKRINLRLAEPKFCTDNAAMVAGLGYHYYKRRIFSELDFDAFARLPAITEVVFV